LNGYNHPDRFRRNNKNGVLADNGEPLPGEHNAVRLPRTDCFSAHHDWTRTHIMGFTSTYNDFDYTGAVFRVEQSFSTKEHVRKLPLGTGRNAFLTDPATISRLSKFTINKNYHTYSPVWRSMVGFDLLRTYKFFSYIPFLHHSFSDQAWFLSGQWLMKNQWSDVANPLCYIVDNGGNGLTKADAKRLSQQTPLLEFAMSRPSLGAPLHARVCQPGVVRQPGGKPQRGRVRAARQGLVAILAVVVAQRAGLREHRIVDWCVVVPR
jgi:hypothetical protein